jgi:hypothetical protein
MVPRRVPNVNGSSLGPLAKPPGGLRFAGCAYNKAPAPLWASEPLKGAPGPSLTSQCISTFPSGSWHNACARSVPAGGDVQYQESACRRYAFWERDKDGTENGTGLFSRE